MSGAPPQNERAAHLTNQQMKRYLIIGVLLVSTITSSFAQPKYNGVVRDATGNVVTSEASATAQAAAGPGATFDSKTGAVYDAKGNLWDSDAALTAQDVGGVGATLE